MRTSLVTLTKSIQEKDAESNKMRFMVPITPIILQTAPIVGCQTQATTVLCWEQNKNVLATVEDRLAHAHFLEAEKEDARPF